MAVTRHMPFEVSTTADSMLVFGSATLVRLSQEHTGAALRNSALGAVSAAHADESAVVNAVRTRKRWTRKARLLLFMEAAFVRRRPIPDNGFSEQTRRASMAG